jgi:hypothetical protein
MKEVAVLLRTGKYCGYLEQPEVGITQIKFDVVNELRLPGAEWLKFAYFSLPNEGNKAQKLMLLEDIAKRIYDFSQATFVNGRGNFDCRAFLGRIMGWDADISPGVEKLYSGHYVQPSQTKNCLPYLISPKDNCITHAVLGIDRPGKSLSVAGVEGPLVIAKNTDLLRAFGGIAMFEVIKAEDL